MGMTTYPAASIANALLEKAASDGETITPMKMQKLLYLIHGYGLVECEDPVIDEVFEAWKFGPVLNSIYHECKGYGRGGIRRSIKDYDYKTGKVRTVPTPSDPIVQSIIDFVWEEYGDESAISLSDWTHEKGGPWDEVTDGGRRILRNQSIPNSSIRSYFERHLYGASDSSETSEA